MTGDSNPAPAPGRCHYADSFSAAEIAFAPETTDPMGQSSVVQLVCWIWLSSRRSSRDIWSTVFWS